MQKCTSQHKERHELQKKNPAPVSHPQLLIFFTNFLLLSVLRGKGSDIDISTAFSASLLQHCALRIILMLLSSEHQGQHQVGVLNKSWKKVLQPKSMVFGMWLLVKYMGRQNTKHCVEKHQENLVKLLPRV